MRAIDRYLIHTITLLRGATGDEGVGTDAYGEPLSDATPLSLTLPARVEWDNRRVAGMNGEEVVCSGMVFLKSKYTDPDSGLPVELDIGSQDRIIFEGRQHAIAKRDRCEAWGWQTDQGAHWEVWIV